ncbi:Cytochrome P450 71A22 [Cercospora beticola]|uniref:Cytochrome P450 71A22 n=1 Tax=Cercospora beticola TaxID=122368 RepID=A0A2G5HRF1_CERBT|nr:Cytochrome P450 71A22 [Cercospora beticola]PIA95119.1 Cytochrome P450 71A22 [Cercospora beticola]WPB05597.1 hypothetical protein RHO25_010250 [Cercospora beticola]CAK1365429.1 unnamed protein product [Cercospora beticola]
MGRALTLVELRGITKYGEMTTLHMGSKTWIMLNSKRVAGEIISKRGAITNERTRMPMSHEVLSRNSRTLLAPLNRWHEPRRLLSSLMLTGSALQRYGEIQELESNQLMAEYILQPELWFRHNYRYANSVIHRIATGAKSHIENQDLKNLQQVTTVFLDSIGSSIVDWFPLLHSIPRPLQFWRSYWEERAQWTHEVLKAWWDPVREQVENGTANPSFVRDTLLNPESKYQGTDEETMYLGMTLIEAGSDTSRMVLNTLAMAAVHYPEAWAKARQEVDSICDTPAGLRLPLMSDLKRMPYCCAIVKELLRWRPIFPYPPDHTLTQDLDLEGYFFPKGTSMVMNLIAIGDECEDPELFRPERWLNGHEADITHNLWQFGGGRRICVGYRLAQTGIFVNVARFAMCFDYEATGKLNSLDLNHETLEEPFPIRVKPRGTKYKQLILDEAERAGLLDVARNGRTPAGEHNGLE